ncbi:MAG TPA: hypothetical protein DEQ56_03205 [Bacteroidetes bacterium]|jgi:hypothetical protein|nr:hypothetical protein [Bacteroidota bacterium]
MKLHTLTIAACFILLIGSCSENETTKSIIGFKPVYGGIEDIQKLITTTTAQPLKSVGKIYTYGNLLLINEVGKGVHVYDNQDPSAPVNLKFIAIPGNVDVALKDGYLYADLNFGIITLDISDLDHVTLTHLNTEYKGNDIQNTPPRNQLDTRPSGKVYFECPEASKGTVITWELVQMPKPQCYMNN